MDRTGEVERTGEAERTGDAGRTGESERTHVCARLSGDDGRRFNGLRGRAAAVFAVVAAAAAALFLLESGDGARAPPAGASFARRVSTIAITACVRCGLRRWKKVEGICRAAWRSTLASLVLRCALAGVALTRGRVAGTARGAKRFAAASLFSDERGAWMRRGRLNIEPQSVPRTPSRSFHVCP